ncbi:MAG: 5-(carboxyamino)imidazole ribonucleotide synthase [Phycisphaeraceae bacterium]|nr:5-(carboxyamino)imidazole ribonucleotide synthase [Phycisphaeraceae bacterium]
MTDSNQPTIGMLGGGQLGQMFCHAAGRAGVRAHVFCPGDGEPATQVCDEKTIAAYDDLDAVERFAQSVDAVTYEFENVPAATAAACAKHCPVRPGQQVLAVAQDRIVEKTTLQDHGIPVGPFAKVQSLDELREAAETIGAPAVLKTASGGYDGKGQRVLHSADEAGLIYAWEDLGKQPCVYEGFIDFEQEVSIVAARGVNGEVVTYGPIANTHRSHILDVSVVPSGAPGSVEAEAIDIAKQVMEKLDVVGVLCVEFFQTRDGHMLVNELAPRPHNSGHLTIDAYTYSQFDQQVACALGKAPLPVELKQPAAMVNLLGDIWPTSDVHDAPLWDVLHSGDALHLHLYGKAQARPGRKMGHLTALARTPHEAIRDAVEARSRVTPRPPIERG